MPNYYIEAMIEIRKTSHFAKRIDSLQDVLASG